MRADLRIDQDETDAAYAREVIRLHRAEPEDRTDRVLGIVLAAVSGAAMACAGWAFFMPMVEVCRG